MGAAGKTILVVDDELKILEVVVSYLTSKGFTVQAAVNGRKALEMFHREPPALVILDLMLPDISGEEVCREIRKTSRVPVIMLTAKVAESDIVDGLSLGADDYVTKPFSLKELSARVEAVLRRSARDLAPLAARYSWRDGDLTISFDKNEVKKKGAAAALTPAEFRLLSALVRYPGKTFTREELIETALGDDFDGYDRAVDSHIKNLRQKIEDDPRNPRYVLTVHGVGYKFGGE
ncbi:MAG: response regulator transcription factor [Methylobacteriaceae bacterium]|jgi:DNA-binding response OmpR family regulator|nr:response regulator transcription factor [Methylobacteriaceae bacterium]